MRRVKAIETSDAIIASGRATDFVYTLKGAQVGISKPERMLGALKDQRELGAALVALNAKFLIENYVPDEGGQIEYDKDEPRRISTIRFSDGFTAVVGDILVLRVGLGAWAIVDGHNVIWKHADLPRPADDTGRAGDAEHPQVNIMAPSAGVAAYSAGEIAILGAIADLRNDIIAAGVVL